MALPTSGVLGIKSGPGVPIERSISMEVDGNEDGPKSLHDLGIKAGFTPPIRMSDFYGYSATILPGPPTNVLAVLTPGTKVDLSWNAPTTGSNPPTNYRIERRLNSGSFVFLHDNGTSRTYTDLTVPAPGSSYRYRVRSENGDGVSAYTESNTVTASL